MVSLTALTTDLPELYAIPKNRGIRVKVSSILSTQPEDSNGVQDVAKLEISTGGRPESPTNAGPKAKSQTKLKARGCGATGELAVRNFRIGGVPVSRRRISGTESVLRERQPPTGGRG